MDDDLSPEEADFVREMEQEIDQAMDRLYDRAWYLSGATWCLLMAAVSVLAQMMGTERLAPFMFLGFALFNFMDWLALGAQRRRG
jgi:mannose/fructose/N-acetylgalactosamine-specific phosphotransferase system component IIC